LEETGDSVRRAAAPVFLNLKIGNDIDDHDLSVLISKLCNVSDKSRKTSLIARDDSRGTDRAYRSKLTVMIVG
jgi:hypothetical protein